MATNEQLIPIPGRLHSLASEGHVAGADEIYDDTQGKLQSTINTEKADKSATVSDVSYDTTNKKIQQTINGTTTDVVSVSTLKTDMSLQKSDVGLGNVENKSSATIRGELTSSDVTTALGYTPPQQDTTYSVMGASGSTHASGLVPDTPTTAGTTKFLREDGTWQEVNAAPEVQLGGSTPSSESEIKLFVDESADDTVEVYTKAQTNGQFVAVVNMNTEPTESTLTYTATDGTTKNFKVGDEVRVPDAEADNGYTFYKLYALASGSATWGKLGAGGAVDLSETVNITLTQVGGNSADLIGVTITITDVENQETLLSTTWQGTTVTTNIIAGTNYEVEVGSVTGYYTLPAKSYIAKAINTRNIEIQYFSVGIYIQSTDRLLHTSTQWTAALNAGDYSNNDVIGVAVVSSSYKFVIATTDFGNTLIYYTCEGSAATDATTDSGKTNTQRMLAVYGSDSTYAAGKCYNYIFKNGEHGYLPADNELTLMLGSNKSSIQSCLTVCGGTLLADSDDIFYWTSNYYGGAISSFGHCHFIRTSHSNSSGARGINNTEQKTLTSTIYVRAICDLV